MIAIHVILHILEFEERFYLALSILDLPLHSFHFRNLVLLFDPSLPAILVSHSRRDRFGFH